MVNVSLFTSWIYQNASTNAEYSFVLMYSLILTLNSLMAQLIVKGATDKRLFRK